jgi:capsid protein
MQALAFTSAWDSGDCFALRRFKESTSFLALAVQLIEADRVSTPVDRQNEELLRDGVELDGDGQPVAYHILNRHPGDNPLYHGLTPQDWARVPALGESGDPLIVHLMDMDRIAQTRGVPSLAPVIESLKQLDRYAEAELMAAVVSAFFTVFIKTTGEESTGNRGRRPPAGHGAKERTRVGLRHDRRTCSRRVDRDRQSEPAERELRPVLPGRDPSNRHRPGHSVRSAHYALLEFVHGQQGRDRDGATVLHGSPRLACERLLPAGLRVVPYRSVARGWSTPGFLDDPIKRAAWCGSEWIGRAPIVLDAVKEATAANLWLANGGRTLEQITTEAFGTDWKSNQEQRGRETALRRGLTIEASVPVGEPTPAELGDNGDSGPDGTGDDNTKGT